MSFALTNARSLLPKIDSLVNYFDEHGLTFCIITETWISNDNTTKDILEELSNGANIEMIRKDRSGRGGGVAIAFNNTKAKFKKYGLSSLSLIHI